MAFNKSTYLNISTRINYGSFYTPAKYVTLASKWIKGEFTNSSNFSEVTNHTFLDSSAGEGVFFAIVKDFPCNTFIASDIDKEAIDTLRLSFPMVKTYNKNALVNISRAIFNINEGDKLFIMGNPPYNDRTSIVNKSIKSAFNGNNTPIDKRVVRRDIGLSFLLSYDILKASYVLVLHPLSYLIKETNFNSAFSFFNNYILLRHIVFSSGEFYNTSSLSQFPIIMAFYKRSEGQGLTYQDIYNMTFNTIEGDKFSLSNYDYIKEYINKYPNKTRYTPDIKFYTLRDMNALSRSRTFIKEDIKNAVHINPIKLPYYCYIDCLKEYIKHNSCPYYMGNLDIPFNKDTFSLVEQDIVSVSKYLHKDIFNNAPPPSSSSIKRVHSYIKSVIENKGVVK